MKPVACLVPHGTDAPPRLRLWCPGCDVWHDPTIAPDRWAWDGDTVHPTLSPSLLVTGGPDLRCHSFVRDGKWQFLSDCTHDLAGQTVPCPPGDEWEWGWPTATAEATS